jgi:hypothetical protein
VCGKEMWIEIWTYATGRSSSSILPSRVSPDVPS